MITPLDIKKQIFTTHFKGYDVDEVRFFLDTVAHDFEEISKENSQLSENLKIAEERLNHYRLIEKTLQDTVITIQTVLEEKSKAAQQEAEIIVREARQKAAEELISSQHRVAELRGEIYGLENQKLQFFTRFRNLLRSQTQILEAMVEGEEQEIHSPGPGRQAPSEDNGQDTGDSRLA